MLCLEHELTSSGGVIAKLNTAADARFAFVFRPSFFMAVTMRFESDGPDVRAEHGIKFFGANPFV